MRQSWEVLDWLGSLEWIWDSSARLYQTSDKISAEGQYLEAHYVRKGVMQNEAALVTAGD
jgi:hypothetical protein